MTNFEIAEINIIRSARRRKSVSARLNDGVLEVRAPMDLAQKELDEMIESLKRRLIKRQRAKYLNNEGALSKRVDELNKRYFEGKLRVEAVRFVSNQSTVIGSCSPYKRVIRISERVASLPKWVADYVIVHELAHLIEANHSPRFWALVNRYPLTERARGYLMALKAEER